MKSKYYVLSLIYNKKRDTYYPYLCYYENGLNVMALPVEELCVLSQKDTVEILMDITTSTPYFVHNPHDSFLCSMPKSYVG